MRVGIGRPVHGDASDYVLGNFTKSELAVLPDLIGNIVDLLALYIREGMKKTMSLYNNRELLADQQE